MESPYFKLTDTRFVSFLFKFVAQLTIASNQEKSTAQPKVADLATVDAARDNASTGVFQMTVIAAPVQGGAAAMSNADKTMDLLDFKSSFLKTLSKFNSLVDKIAAVWYLCIRSKSCELMSRLDQPVRTSSMGRSLFCFRGQLVEYYR